MSDRSEKIPVIDIFGPVIQGEGAVIGKQTYFVRTGGCDYLCSACDSMHAVDPAQISANKKVMSAKDIFDELNDTFFRYYKCNMVTISGGNPLVWDLHDLVWRLLNEGKVIAVETQGSIYKPWLEACKYVTVSPKGPGMVGPKNDIKSIDHVLAFLGNWRAARKIPGAKLTIKIPVFDRADLQFANTLLVSMHEESHWHETYLSTGNSWVDPQGQTTLEQQRTNLLQRYSEITKMVITEFPLLAECTILPQLHVLVWGNARDK